MTTTSATSGGDALRELAAALASVSVETADARAVRAAKQRIFDALGAACVGFETAEGAQALALDRELRALGAAPHALDRCRLLAAAVRSTEIDDIDVASCTTVGSVVVPAALAIAAAGADAHALLAGVIAGYEAMTRLGRAIGGATLIYRGVWPTYVCASFGAAAAAARVLGSDADALERALRLALARTSAPPRGALASPGFRYFALGGAVVEGCAAALASRTGVGAPGKPAGFAERIGAAVDEAELAAERAGARVAEVDTKMFPSSRQALASVEAFLALGPTLPPPERIERIVVAVPGVYREMIDRPATPAGRIESLLSVQYQIALAALDADALHDALRGGLRRDEKIAELMAKIDVRADESLGRAFPDRWGSSVTVRSRSGEELRSEVIEPRGSGRRELDWGALVAKLERILAASGLERPGLAAALRARCESLGGRDAPAGAAAELLGIVEAVAARAGPKAAPAAVTA